MNGHIRRRGATWYYKHELPRDPVTGKRKYAEKGGFRTKREAIAGLNESLTKLHKGEFLAEERTSLADYFREWLPRYETTVRDTTAARNRSLVNNRVIPGIGHIKLQQLRPQHLEDFYGSLIDVNRGAAALSPATVKSIHGVISRALSDAERHGRINRNPATNAKTPRDTRPAKEKEWWSADDVARFLSGMQGHHRHCLWHVALHTGLRRGELLGLCWPDIDFDECSLTVHRQLVAASHHGVFADPKTSAGRRRVDLDTTTIEILKRHQMEQMAARIDAGSQWQDFGLVYCAEDGQPFLPRSVSAWLKKDIKRLGLPATSVHDLRHAHASMAMRAGVSPKIVQERLGHADVKTTLGIYSHVMPGMQRDAADQIADLIARSGTESREKKTL